MIKVCAIIMMALIIAIALGAACATMIIGYMIADAFGIDLLDFGIDLLDVWKRFFRYRKPLIYRKAKGGVRWKQ